MLCHRENLLHSAMFLCLDAHLNFQCEHLQKDVSFVHIVRLLVVEVLHIARFAAFKLELFNQLGQLVKASSVQVEFAQTQTCAEPKSFVRRLQTSQN